MARLSSAPKGIAALPTGEGVHQIPIGSVIPNPQNADIYETVVDDNFVFSIQNLGVLEPIVITPERIVLSGHRRLLAARTAGLETVPVVVRDVTASQQLETILEYNQQRRKTLIERLREFRAYLAIEAEVAETRMLSGVANLPQGATGKARDLAAERVGLSGRSAENGWRVLEEIDRRRSRTTDGEAVETVTRALLKSINCGVRAAMNAGWLKSSESSPKRSDEPEPPPDAEKPCWIGPSSWELFVDSCETGEERTRLSRAFKKFVAILQHDLAHSDPTTRFDLQEIFMLVVSKSYEMNAGERPKEGKNQQPEAGDTSEKAAK